MSYQVLARKYRPRSFDTLVGQEHVVRALTHALDKKRLHHAYLFTGTRGVGKTTLSRILAKSFNCQGADGNGDITARPCGVCDACISIDAGRFVDYIEMDAASNRGVDDMAQLLEQAVYAPSNARFKVYMIDEVHMLTNQAFNSMLKTLEEPPEHVKFILATTDPQKIPVTVLSRCLQFNLKQMPPGHIVGHLENILGQETIEFDVPALRLLAQGARGSMRDALSLTDQAIAYAAGRVTLDAVQGMLGALDQTFLVRMLDALAAADGAALLGVADDMAARSLSYNAALQDLGTLLHRIALAQTVPAALPEDLPERAEIMRLATAFDAEEVQLFYQIAVHGRNELGLAPDEYAGFTMTLLRMLAFRPGVAPAGGGTGSGGQGRPAARAALAAAGATAAVSPRSQMNVDARVVSTAAPAAAPLAMPVTAQAQAPAPAQTLPARSDEVADAVAAPVTTQQAVPQASAWEDEQPTSAAAAFASTATQAPMAAMPVQAVPAGTAAGSTPPVPAHAALAPASTPTAAPTPAQTQASAPAAAAAVTSPVMPAQTESRPTAALSPAMAALAAARGGKLPASARATAQESPQAVAAPVQSAPAFASAPAPAPAPLASPAPSNAAPAAAAATAPAFRPAPAPLPVPANAAIRPAPAPLAMAPSRASSASSNEEAPPWDEDVPMFDADYEPAPFDSDLSFESLHAAPAPLRPAPAPAPAPAFAPAPAAGNGAATMRAGAMPDDDYARVEQVPADYFQDGHTAPDRPPTAAPSARPAAPSVSSQPATLPASLTSMQPAHDTPDVSDVHPARTAPVQAVAVSTAAANAEPAPRPSRQPAPQIDLTVPFVAVPVAELGWDGNWPQLAAGLNLRGVAQQLAMQSELVECELDGGAFRLQLRVPVETYRSAANIEKLATAVSEHFGKTIRVGTEIGPVRHTASAAAQADRESRQLAAEETINNDPFVLTLMREFGAYITPGSIRPL